MGSILFKRREPKQKTTQEVPQTKQNQVIELLKPARKLRYQLDLVYDPAPVFKQISANKMAAIDKSPILKELINNQNWDIQIIEHLRIFNVFQLIQKCNARVLVVKLYHNITSNCTSKLRLEAEKKEANIERSIETELIVQQYSEIYSSLFNLQFLRLRKLVIKGHSKLHQEAIVSLQVLQYLDSPCLQQLHADGHNLTSLRFLRKCHWKHLNTLNIRETNIYDSSHFASVLPYISNSRHIQTLNLASKTGTDWFELSWLLKMGFASADSEKIRMDEDDQYYFMNQERVLRRIEFGISNKLKIRQKHISMIKRKFNNSYFDNPLVMW